MISSFIPVVSGRRAIFAGSLPAMTAAACMTSPPPDPLTTSPASAPQISASTWPAARLSSFMSTMTDAVRCMTAAASGRSFDPPHIVVVPEALITGWTPKDWYISSPLIDRSIQNLVVFDVGWLCRIVDYTTCSPAGLQNHSWQSRLNGF